KGSVSRGARRRRLVPRLLGLEAALLYQQPAVLQLPLYLRISPVDRSGCTGGRGREGLSRAISPASRGNRLHGNGSGGTIDIRLQPDRERILGEEPRRGRAAGGSVSGAALGAC